jgi:hypothetical protein
MPDTPEKPGPGSIEYDRGSGSAGSARRYRLLLALTLLNTLMLAGLIVGPYVMPFAREKWQQWQVARAMERERQRIAAFEQQCMDHAAPADQVVYEEDPVAAAKLLARPGGAYDVVMRDMGATVPPGYQPPVFANVPDYVREFDRLASGYVSGGGGGGGLFAGSATDAVLLFMHERTTPGGQKLLVEVWLTPGIHVGSNETQTDAGSYRTYTATKSRQLTARAWTVPPAPAEPLMAHEWTTLLALPDMEQLDMAQAPIDKQRRAVARGGGGARPNVSTQPVPIHYGNRLRFFAGQIDPADPSHFTIGYQVDGQAGTIDGRVRDTGLVLRPSGGAPAGEEVMEKLDNSRPPYDEVWDLIAPTNTTRPADDAR